jgi:hypothetical protein
MVRSVFGIFLCFWFLTVGAVSIAAPPPRPILVLNESAMVGPFYRNAYDALRSTVTTSSQPVSIYLEQLELERFGGDRYELDLKTHFQSKYVDKPIGVIVALGFGALDFVLRLRTGLFTGVPVVFVMVDDVDLKRLNLPPDVYRSHVHSEVSRFPKVCAHCGAGFTANCNCRGPLGETDCI